MPFLLALTLKTWSEQEEICKSLKDYNSQIEQLKQEMDDATHGADNIRSDIGALAQRYTVIDREEECGVRNGAMRSLWYIEFAWLVPVAVFI